MKSYARKSFLISVLAIQACSQAVPGGPSGSEITADSLKKNQPHGAANTSGGDPKSDLKKNGTNVLLADTEVFDFLKTQCSSCHGLDAQGKPGPNASFWTLSAEGLSLEGLETSLDTPRVYAALYRSIHTVPNPQPQAMPPSASEATKAKIKEVEHWFQVKLPVAVAEASSRYAGLQEAGGNATMIFKCENPLTVRQFVNKFFLAAFDVPPTQNELTELGTQLDLNSLDVPVTKVLRTRIVSLLDDTRYSALFRTSGIPKLAQAISGAPFILTNKLVSNDLKAALGKEFEALLLSKWNEWSYDAYFSADVVMVNKLTAPLYGCSYSSPDPTKYIACQMKAPRKGFFTTAGFLSARSSSFLIENNNYGRVAGVYFSLLGEGLKAATTGPKGSGKIPALPGCLESNDMRAFAAAPRGTAAIPKSGTLCQSCHIGRNLAAGSVLFRPFGPSGQIFDPETLGDSANSDKALVDAATKPEWTAATYDPQPIDITSLKNLLRQSLESPQACAVSGPKPEDVVKFNNVADLVGELMKNGDALASGFARHAQRAFGNRENISLDLILDVRANWRENKRSLDQLTKTYFLAENFSCKTN